MSRKLTPWHPPSINPVRVGWYQRRWPQPWQSQLYSDSGYNIWFNFFDGKDWWMTKSQMPNAIAKNKGVWIGTAMEWRGLARKPK